MLRELVEYAEKHDLVTEPGFAPKEARWAIQFSENGDYLGVVEIGDVDDSRNRGQEFTWAPDMSHSEIVSGTERRCHFLIESAEVVALYTSGEPAEKELEKHAYFVGLLRKASDAVPELGDAADALEDEATLEQIRSDLDEQGAGYTDKVTIRRGGRCPVGERTWHDWWREFRQTLTSDDDDQPRLFCDFASGELVEPASTHPKVSGLQSVGGQAAGSSLVSFDKDAFTSYGLEQSANCAVSEETAASYRSALDDLLQNHSRRLGDMMAVHWFKKAVPPEDDPVGFILGTDATLETDAQRKARELLEAIHRGDRPDLGQNYYYAMMMSGSGGRVMIRNWIEGQFEALVRNVDQWFADLEIVHREGSGNAPPPKFLAVIGGTVRDLDDAPAPFISEMLQSAIDGGRIPRSAMTRALWRARVDIMNDNPPNHACMGLLKAYHVRQNRKGGDAMSEDLKPSLNEDHPSAAYQCGRLMAVLAGLQRSALGDVGAGVVQRYYAAASTTPSLVLGRLTRNSQFHLNKLSGDSPGLAYWYEDRLGAIYTKLGDAIPQTLAPEEQSLFALGYYQQLVDLRTKKNENDTPEGENDSE